MTPHLADPNIYAEHARQRKAHQLADWLEAHDFAGVTIEGLTDLPTPWWKAVAAHAGCNPPSPQTIAVVIETLRRRANVRATL